jgi:hypothetical protein
MSRPLYTCTESALMISPFNLSARANEIAVLPTAVGPVTTRTLGLLVDEVEDWGKPCADPDIDDMVNILC